MNFKQFKASPITTIGGIIMLLIALLTQVFLWFDGDATTNPNIGTMLAELVTGIIALFARDNTTTSEQVIGK